MAFKKLLDEISVIPGVTGSCIFDRHEGPLCTDSNANIATDILLKVGSFLSRMLKMGAMHGLEIAGSHYRFDNCTVVSTPLGSDSILLTICETKANCSLVATTAAMLAADMAEQMDKKAAQSPRLKNQPEPASIEIEEEPPADNIKESFSLIEEALVEAIGPVAGMILQDAIDKWQQEGPSSAARLQELTNTLGKEIDDEELLTAFRSRVATIL